MNNKAFALFLGAVLVAAAPQALAKKDGEALPPGLQKKVERGGELPPTAAHATGFEPLRNR